MLDDNEQQSNILNSLMRPKKYICLCKSVTKETIVEAYKNGSDTLKKIQMSTLACTGCGTCMDSIKEIITELNHSVSQNNDKQKKLPL